MSADTAAAVHRFRVTRDEEDPRVWLAEWVEDDRVHTFARSLAELEDLAGDALALWLHTDADDVQVELDVELPKTLSRELTQLRRQRDELEAHQASVLDRQRSLAVRLVEAEGMTYRDAARLLGISHQRVAQLVKQSA
ncbi:MAG TPA: helix-turn-helix domain-containing protein [Nitriliruptorales bacterium]|nr:helix-turn-helix domain-containing protein [Nitriliruptorales bacterium]